MRVGLALLFSAAASMHALAKFHGSTHIGRDHGLIARSPPSDKSVIIQMFEWNWDSVAAECTAFIGPAGYGYVQVSPPQEHIQGDQWWTDYQAVSYNLTSKRGNRQQFANMVSTCHNAGVKVLADTLFNHMSGLSSGTGSGGTQFTQFNYPGVWTSDNFHYCNEPNYAIQNWDDIVQVWTCELEGLADLATETDAVQARLAEYASDLLSLGVDGLRLDAAKSMNVTDIAGILARLPTKPYITQEVVWGNGQPVTPNMYTSLGKSQSDVQEFRYATALENAFQNNNLTSLQSFDGRGWVPSGQANSFVVNHDTERSGGALNYKAPNNIYTNAMVFSLAHPYGTPTILSSYTFDDDDQGGPNGGNGTCSGATGTNGWLCQHRWTPVAGMVGFHNEVGTAPLTNFVSGTSGQIAFGRGTAGFVAFNNEDSAWTTTFQTSLPDGTYCDVVSGAKTGSTCSGSSFTVSGGSFKATVANRSAIAIHAASNPNSPSNTNITNSTATPNTTTTEGNPSNEAWRSDASQLMIVLGLLSLLLL